MNIVGGDIERSARVGAKKSEIAGRDATIALRRLLPSSVAVDCRSDNDRTEGAIEPTAEMTVNAGSARIAEFRTGRGCARRALDQLGEPQTDIPIGSGGQPLWPPGFVGSLSHCAGLRAAAVARLHTVRSIGIDVELNRPLLPIVVATITRDGEASMIRDLALRNPAVAWSAVLWSAKESIFKAWYPLTEQWRDYTKCAVTIRLANGSFRGRMIEATGRVTAADIPLVFSGRWTTVGAHILTAVVVRQPGAQGF